MKRIRTTIWETTDGQRWTDEKAAIQREKFLALQDILEAAINYDEVESAIKALLASDRIVIVLKPTPKGDRA